MFEKLNQFGWIRYLRTYFTNTMANAFPGAKFLAELRGRDVSGVPGAIEAECVRFAGGSGLLRWEEGSVLISRWSLQ